MNLMSSTLVFNESGEPLHVHRLTRSTNCASCVSTRNVVLCS